MSFVLFLSIVAMTTAIVGCIAIWGFDVSRAKEVERDVAKGAADDRARLDAAPARPELRSPETL